MLDYAVTKDYFEIAELMISLGANKPSRPNPFISDEKCCRYITKRYSKNLFDHIVGQDVSSVIIGYL